jgi:PAS domain S-box-containing protein
VKNNKAKQTFVRLTPVTSVFHVVVAAFIVALFLLNIDITNKSYLIYILIPLVSTGLLYNLVFFRLIVKRREFFAKYLQYLLIIAEFGTIVYFTAGTNSIWYPVFLMLIVGGSVLGFTAFFLNTGIIVLFYISQIVVTIINSSDQLKFTSFPATVSAVFFAGLIAFATDKHVKRVAPSDKISAELGPGRLSERMMLGSIADPVIGINNDQKIILMNEAAQNLTGWDMHDALNIDLGQVLKLKNAQDKEVTSEDSPYAAVITSHHPLRSDKYYVLRKGEQKVSLSISISPTTNEEGQYNGAISVIRDISEQKELEREKNEFISVASHEMRTPVAAIEGYISMAQNPKLAQIDDKAKGFLDKAHDSSIHLGRLFQDLLSVSKIEDKNIKESRQVFNLSDLILKTANELQIIANKKHIQLTTHIGGAGIRNEKVIAPTFMINADPDRISEVLTNLIDNAIKYTAQGSVDVEVSADDNFVSVKVHDTGMGISAQEQKHIFEKFYRVDNELTREQSGTGLGLYITRNLVERYGGTIWVESKLGQGSTFAFKLPLAKV